jgi:hypothetical protein
MYIELVKSFIEAFIVWIDLVCADKQNKEKIKIIANIFFIFYLLV